MALPALALPRPIDPPYGCGGWWVAVLTSAVPVCGWVDACRAPLVSEVSVALTR